MSKHTKEPWAVSGLEVYANRKTFIVDCGYNDKIIYPRCKANATRIVECVNAMAGIENPDEYVRTMREVHDTLATTREKLEITMTELKTLSHLIMRISNKTTDIAILNDINDTLEELKS